MSYHFTNNQLRVFGKYVREQRNKNVLEKTRFIILEHILPTTENMIKQLRNGGGEVFAVVAKPYSIVEDVMESLVADGITVIKKSYFDLENTDVLLQLLKDAVEGSKKDSKAIIIIDVGGYFAKPIINLQSIMPECTEYITGIVEDTTFGHNRYIKEKDKINVPIFSVARSSLKEIEARFVGQDAVFAMETILREKGILMSGRHALVIGYGMIGKNVALALKNSHLVVSVYDKYDHRNLAAYIDGFNIHKRRELIKSADIIFFATGNPDGALSFEEIEECKDSVILVSAGSKNTEFDLATLELQAEEKIQLSKYLAEYVLQNGRRIIVANNGTAVNFILPSLSVEVLDLVFSEILLCSLLLLRKKFDPEAKDMFELHKIHNSEEMHRATISKDWLRSVNS